MKANFLSPRAGMGGDFFADGFQYPEPELVEAVRQGIEAHKALNCERCDNATAKAIRRVQAQWVVAGIGIDE